MENDLETLRYPITRTIAMVINHLEAGIGQPVTDMENRIAVAIDLLADLLTQINTHKPS